MLKRIIFCAVLASSLSCSRAKQEGPASVLSAPALHTQAGAPRELLTLNSLAIMPFAIAETARHSSFRREQFYVELTEAATRELDFELAAGSDFLEKFADGVHANDLSSALEFGRSKGAAAVLIPTLTTFVEREGSRVGAEQPAQVSFELKIYRVSDSSKLWEASYVWSDKPLSDDVLRVGSRFGESGSAHWRSAGDILGEGLGQALAELTQARLAQFR